MEDSIEKAFSNPDNVKNLLVEARSKWTTKLTIKEYDKIMATLAFAFLYCPEDLRDMVDSTIKEMEIRVRMMGGAKLTKEDY